MFKSTEYVVVFEVCFVWSGTESESEEGSSNNLDSMAFNFDKSYSQYI